MIAAGEGASPEAIAAFERVKAVADAMCAYGLSLRQHESATVADLDDSDHISKAEDFIYHAAGEIEAAAADIIYADRNGVAGVVTMLSTLPLIALPAATDRTVTLPEGVTTPGQRHTLEEFANRVLMSDADLKEGIGRKHPTAATLRRQIALVDQAYHHFDVFRMLICGVVEEPPGMYTTCYLAGHYLMKTVDLMRFRMDTITTELRAHLHFGEAIEIEHRIKDEHPASEADDE